MTKKDFEAFLSLVNKELDPHQDVPGELEHELRAVCRLLSRVEFRFRPVPQNHVQALEHLEQAAQNALSGPAGDIAQRILMMQKMIFWSHHYSGKEGTLDFVKQLGVGEIIGPQGPVFSNKVILGAVLLGPDTYYPLHAHQASEIYYILSGRPLFGTGEADWEQKIPGSFALHPEGFPHAIKTGRDPMLALFTWRGDIFSSAYILPDSSQSS